MIEKLKYLIEVANLEFKDIALYCLDEEDIYYTSNSDVMSRMDILISLHKEGLDLHDYNIILSKIKSWNRK